MMKCRKLFHNTQTHFGGIQNTHQKKFKNHFAYKFLTL